MLMKRLSALRSLNFPSTHLLPHTLSTAPLHPLASSRYLCSRNPCPAFDLNPSCVHNNHLISSSSLLNTRRSVLVISQTTSIGLWLRKMQQSTLCTSGQTPSSEIGAC